MYKIGDEITLKIDRSSETITTFEGVKVQVIGGDLGDGQYLCYVSHEDFVKRSFRITKAHQRSYRFDDKFLNETGVFITEWTDTLKLEPAEPGAICDQCKQFVRQAQRVDGKFKCYPCREDPWRCRT